MVWVNGTGKRSLVNIETECFEISLGESQCFQLK